MRLAAQAMVVVGILWVFASLILSMAELAGAKEKILEALAKVLLPQSGGTDKPEAHLARVVSLGGRSVVAAMAAVSGIVGVGAYYTAEHVNKEIRSYEARVSQSQAEFRSELQAQNLLLQNRLTGLSYDLGHVVHSQGCLTDSVVEAAKTIGESLKESVGRLGDGVVARSDRLVGAVCEVKEEIEDARSEQAALALETIKSLGDVKSTLNGAEAQLAVAAKDVHESMQQAQAIGDAQQQVARDQWLVERELASRSFGRAFIDAFSGARSNRIRLYHASPKRVSALLKANEPSYGQISEGDGSGRGPLTYECRFEDGAFHVRCSELTPEWTRVEIIGTEQSKGHRRTARKLLRRLDSEVDRHAEERQAVVALAQ